jgi:hypothetical protein
LILEKRKGSDKNGYPVKLSVFGSIFTIWVKNVVYLANKEKCYVNDDLTEVEFYFSRRYRKQKIERYAEERSKDAEQIEVRYVYKKKEEPLVEKEDLSVEKEDLSVEQEEPSVPYEEVCAIGDKNCSTCKGHCICDYETVSEYGKEEEEEEEHKKEEICTPIRLCRLYSKQIEDTGKSKRKLLNELEYRIQAKRKFDSVMNEILRKQDDAEWSKLTERAEELKEKQIKEFEAGNYAYSDSEEWGELDVKVRELENRKRKERMFRI